MSAGALGSDTMVNQLLGLAYALPGVVDLGYAEASCSLGMKGDNFEDGTALQIGEAASGPAYALIALPVFRAWCFAAWAAPHGKSHRCVVSTRWRCFVSYLLKSDLQNRHGKGYSTQHFLLDVRQWVNHVPYIRNI